MATDCPNKNCTFCNPPPPPESRPHWICEAAPRHWARYIHGSGVRLAALLPELGSAERLGDAICEQGRRVFWTVAGGEQTGYCATLVEAQLAAELAAVPLLRAALATLEAEQHPGIYCPHCSPDAATCGVCRRGLEPLPAQPLDALAPAPWDETQAGPPGEMPADGGLL